MAAPIITSSSGEASTGQVFTLSHGASSWDTNRAPPVTRRIGWVEMSEWRSASARSSPFGTCVRFSTRYDTSRRVPAGFTVSDVLARIGPCSNSLEPATVWGSAWWRSPLGRRKRTSAVISPSPSTMHWSSR